MSSDEQGSPRALPELIAAASPRGQMDSVTEVNGTVARFEMAYSPPSRGPEKFGPPLRQRLGSILFLTVGLVVVALVGTAYYASSSNSALYRWIVEGDHVRPLPSPVLAIMIFVSAVGTVARARMRGVVVHPDGLEARYLLPLGVPRVKRWAWAQIERVLVDDRGAMVELWDSTYERLPDVAQPRELGVLLERVAASRKIAVTRLEDIRER